MPRENKKRGRRGEEKKRKLEVEDGAEDGHESPKRARIDDNAEDESFANQHDFQALGCGNVENEATNGHGHDSEKPFFGMLDEEEQDYFRKADEMLELNNFADSEERSLFLANVYQEAEGKELKLANSQSCSRLMERLIQLSSPQQLKKLFQKFHSHFVHLIQHRFASHCCEKLFIQSAPVVTKELTSPPDPEAASISLGDVYVSMEDLFLYTVAELQGNIGFLMTDRFASHALRVLLLVLAGEPLSSSTAKSLLQSKRKEKIEVNGVNAANGVNGTDVSHHSDRKRAVPKAFSEALEKLMVDSVAGLDTNALRALATHQMGNPTLQLLIRLELKHFGKQRSKDETSVLRTLLPDDPITADSESATFINGLMYDPVGSHLIETIIEFSSGKMFKNLYKEFFKDRIGTLARNEIAGYIVCKVLERLSREDLIEAHEAIIPQIPSLLERKRTTVITTLVQRCAVREVDTLALALALEAASSDGEGLDIAKLLCYETPAKPNEDGADVAKPHPDRERQRSDPDKLHASLLVQAMILVPGPLSGLIFDALPKLDPDTLIAMANEPIMSRTLQAAMTSTNASIIPRRKLIQQFYGRCGDMALDKYASRVVDAIWEGTHGLAFIRERIAEELAENEAAMRDSPCGRGVWKNWKMDLYKRRRSDWVAQSKNKASNDGFQSFSELDKNKKKIEQLNLQDGEEEKPKPKTGLQAARERAASRRQESERRRGIGAQTA